MIAETARREEPRRRLVGLALLLACTTGCQSCTRRGGEPQTLLAHCDGNRLTYCAEAGRSYGIDFGTRRASFTCRPKDVCIEDHPGGAACVHAPASRCDPDADGGASACDGDDVLACMPPSPSVFQPYVVVAKTCPSGTRCVAGRLGADCEAREK